MIASIRGGSPRLLLTHCGEPEHLALRLNQRNFVPTCSGVQVRRTSGVSTRTMLWRSSPPSDISQSMHLLSACSGLIVMNRTCPRAALPGCWCSIWQGPGPLRALHRSGRRKSVSILHVRLDIDRTGDSEKPAEDSPPTGASIPVRIDAAGSSSEVLPACASNASRKLHDRRAVRGRRDLDSSRDQSGRLAASGQVRRGQDRHRGRWVAEPVRPGPTGQMTHHRLHQPHDLSSSPSCSS